jgi:hypothetical protein
MTGNKNKDPNTCLVLSTCCLCFGAALLIAGLVLLAQAHAAIESFDPLLHECSITALYLRSTVRYACVKPGSNGTYRANSYVGGCQRNVCDDEYVFEFAWCDAPECHASQVGSTNLSQLVAFVPESSLPHANQCKANCDDGAGHLVVANVSAQPAGWSLALSKVEAMWRRDLDAFADDTSFVEACTIGPAAAPPYAVNAKVRCQRPRDAASLADARSKGMCPPDESANPQCVRIFEPLPGANGVAGRLMKFWGITLLCIAGVMFALDCWDRMGKWGWLECPCDKVKNKGQQATPVVAISSEEVEMSAKLFGGPDRAEIQ